ncbi:MAG: hypothetical protein ABSE63_10465, partial [Thermoguttaceae bacterium]
EVQSNANVEVNAIHTGTLTIGAGATLTIAAIPGGPLAADSALTPLAPDALLPNQNNTDAQPTDANIIASSSSTDTTTVTPGPLADSTVIATHSPASSEAATMAASSSSLLSDSNALTPGPFPDENALSPGPSPKGRGEVLVEPLNVLLEPVDVSLEPLSTVLDAVATPTTIIADTTLPVGLVETTPARLIDTAINRLPSQSPIYSWIGLTTLPKVSENWWENPLAGKQASNASTAVFASLHDGLPLRAGIIEKRDNALATNGRQVDFATWQTIVDKTGDDVDFDIARHARAGKHAGQLEKAIDTVIAEDEDLFLLVQ